MMPNVQELVATRSDAISRAATSTSTFFSDFADGVKDYPSANVVLDINSLRAVSGTGGSVNVNEVWGFKITVTNNGDLNMNNVTLHFGNSTGVTNQDPATVSTTSGGPFQTGFIQTPAIPTIPAHGSATTGELFFKAPATASLDTKGNVVDTQLLSTHLNSFDYDLNFLLNALSGHTTTPEKALVKEVFP